MFRQPQFILDMTANHKTYGGMNLSFLHQQSSKRKIWDFESKQAGNVFGKVSIIGDCSGL